MNQKMMCWILFGVIFALSACSKDSERLAPGDQEISSSSQLKAATVDIPTQIKNATSYAEIPLGSYYRMNPIYKTSYRHLRQPTDTSCSWTSYVILLGCISNLTWYGYPPTSFFVERYPVTPQQVYRVTRWCGSSYIVRLASYAKSVDYSFCTSWCFSTPNRFEAVKAMLIHLSSTGAPFLVLSTRGVGHYRIVCSLDWQGNGSNSWVYYTDCFDPDRGSFAANIQCMRFDLFLNLMVDVPNNYNMLFLYRR